MHEVEVPPSTDLRASLGAVGYELRTALADIVDNSITAGARNVQIRFDGGESPYIAVTDDGRGMGREALRVAMQLAGTGPGARRSETDLGRFGLGLKTASFSQCRCLSVCTRGPDGLIGAQWDQARIARTQRWSLVTFADEEVDEQLQHGLGVPAPRGTTVVWTDLEPIRMTWGEGERALNLAMDGAIDWLSLVFHRFLNGDHVERINISVNGAPVLGKDPFLRGHRATSVQSVQTFSTASGPVRVTPVTLPHQDKLGRAERERLGLRGEHLIDTQGFYVYRANRLLHRGKWFGQQRAADRTKLTRVAVDVGNDMDAAWSLDIKKSVARPPRALLEQLKVFMDRMGAPSRRTQTFRGRKADAPGRVWQYVADRDGAFRYDINRDHPALRALLDDVDPGLRREVENVVGIIERTFPIHDAALHVNGDEKVSPSTPNDGELLELVMSLRRKLRSIGVSDESMATTLQTFEPLDQLDLESIKVLLEREEMDA